MLKNFKTKIVSLFIVFFMFALLPAFSYINSNQDIISKANTINSIVNYDFYNIVNKNELIGYRLEMFEMRTNQYKNAASMSANKLQGLSEQLNATSKITQSGGSSPISEPSIYQEANNILTQFDAQTMSYVYEVKRYVPTITYQRFLKKFQAYYNSLNITGAKIAM